MFKMEDPALKLPDVIGRSLVLNVGGQRLICGVIARSAGLFQNPKTICACDGVTIWNERFHQNQFYNYMFYNSYC